MGNAARPIDTPEIRDAARKVAEVYKESCVGGGLHVQVDDWNLGDSFFTDEDREELETDAERDAFDALRPLCVYERASVLFWSGDLIYPNHGPTNTDEWFEGHGEVKQVHH